MTRYSLKCYSIVMKWDKEELERLYWTDGKSLQEIGVLFGVTRERVNQIMKRFLIPRRDLASRQKNRPHQSNPHFKGLADYLERGKDYTETMRKYLPANISCGECGSRVNIEVHHIKYPAYARNDIQILCKSCHCTKHRKGIGYVQQIDIYNAFSSGISVKQLCDKYHITPRLVYKITAKIKNGYSSLIR